MTKIEKKITAINSIIGERPVYVDVNIEEILQKLSALFSPEEKLQLATLAAVYTTQPDSISVQASLNWQRLQKIARRFSEEVFTDRTALVSYLLGSDFIEDILNRIKVVPVEVDELVLVFTDLSEDVEEG